jgi:hypothetical protein
MLLQKEWVFLSSLQSPAAEQRAVIHKKNLITFTNPSDKISEPCKNRLKRKYHATSPAIHWQGPQEYAEHAGALGLPQTSAQPASAVFNKHELKE